MTTQRERDAEVLEQELADIVAGQRQREQQQRAEPPPGGRRVKLTRASEIEIRPVVWVWQDNGYGRIPAGTLSIMAGREGTGKSSCAIWLAAQMTRGLLPGRHFGQPRPVFYLAVEDSWSQTIVPRLAAAGANLDLIYRFEVVADNDEDVMLSLPADNLLLEESILTEAAALVVIDPLMSVLSERIDTHRTREVRLALDPLAKLADRTGAVLIGIAHFNKAGGTDAASLLSGSHAFRDVPRSIFGFAKDDDNRVMSQVKNSLGRDDLPSLQYVMEPVLIDTPSGVAETARFSFAGESDRSVADLLRDAHGSDEDRSERDEAVSWLIDYLSMSGGSASAADAIRAAAAVGIAKTTLTRARKRSGVRSVKIGMAGGWFWTLEESTEGTEESSHQGLDSSDSSVDSSGPPDPDPEALIRDQLGATEVPCRCCGLPLDPYLAANGDTSHPACICNEEMSA